MRQNGVFHSVAAVVTAVTVEAGAVGVMVEGDIVFLGSDGKLQKLNISTKDRWVKNHSKMTISTVIWMFKVNMPFFTLSEK